MSPMEQKHLRLGAKGTATVLAMCESGFWERPLEKRTGTGNLVELTNDRSHE